MSLTISEQKKSSITPLADGTYPATCYFLADIGIQNNERFGRKMRQVVIGWEIAGETVEIEGEQRPRTFFNTYTASLDKKAKLRDTLKAWRGQDFTLEELKAFDLHNILGATCFLTITTTKRDDGRVYSNLASVSKLTKNFPMPTPVLEPVVYDIDNHDPEVFKELPEWVKKKIVESESYKGEAVEFKEIDESDGQLPF